MRTLLVLAFFVGSLAAPASAQPSHEVAIQEAIVRGNAAQVEAIATHNPNAASDAAVGTYAQQLVRTNRELIEAGVLSIELVNIEWGPVSISSDGTSATATTFETWRTSFAEGPTEFARDRNVYSLVHADGRWRISGNAHPDGRRPPRDTLPRTEPTPAPDVEVPSGQGTSRNWAGYAARGGAFTSVAGTWIVPEIPIDSPFGADAAWVGIGGLRTRDLIQAGTQQLVSGSGRVTYQAWYEKLPDYSHPVPLTVLPGHTVSVSIERQTGDTWLITLTNVTTGQVHQRTEEYSSSLSSAEWIQEAPYARRRILPLSNFGTLTFTSGSAVRDGQPLTIAELGARAIALVDPTGRALAVPSPLGPDGASFSVART